MSSFLLTIKLVKLNLKLNVLKWNINFKRGIYCANEMFFSFRIVQHSSSFRFLTNRKFQKNYNKVWPNTALFINHKIHNNNITWLVTRIDLTSKLANYLLPLWMLVDNAKTNNYIIDTQLNLLSLMAYTNTYAHYRLALLMESRVKPGSCWLRSQVR